MTQQRKRVIMAIYLIAAVLVFAIASLSLPSGMGFLIGLIFGIFPLISAFRKYRIPVTEASRYAAERLNVLKSNMDSATWTQKESLAERYINRYFSEISIWLAFYKICVVLLALFYVIFFKSVSVWIFLVVLWMLTIPSILVQKKFFNRVTELLTQECQPLAAAIAFLKPIGTRQYLRIGRNQYGYFTIITLGFYYMGDFETALVYLDKIWEESPKRVKNSIHQVHYHNLRVNCLQELSQEEAAAAERQWIEDYITAHPKYRKHTYIMNYLCHKNVGNLISEQRYEEAADLIRNRCNAPNPAYLRVAEHYRMWMIACLQKNVEEIEIHKGFINQYGKDMFYYARVNGEPQ